LKEKKKKKVEQYPLEISRYLLQPSHLYLCLCATTAAVETKDVISNFFHENHLPREKTELLSQHHILEAFLHFYREPKSKTQMVGHLLLLKLVFQQRRIQRS
jgi:hypothetical protein